MKKIFLIGLALSFIGCTNQAPVTQEEIILEQEKIDTKYADDWGYDPENYNAPHGKLIVNGYYTLTEKLEDFCPLRHDPENCQMYTHVSFNILDSDNENFVPQLFGKRETVFNGEQRLELGCLEDDILWRMSRSDELSTRENIMGMKKYTSSSEISDAILNSSADNPITIQLEQYLATYDGGTPNCFSNFAKVNLVE